MRSKFIFLSILIISIFGLIIYCDENASSNNVINSSYNKLLLESNGSSGLVKLYDKVADGAVLDNIMSDTVADADGINFSKGFSKTNGIGNFILSGTESNDYPIYYYRGAKRSGTYDVNNNVVFSDLCFKIVRTTETGGVKLIFDGFVKDGKCYYDYAGYPSKYFLIDYNLKKSEEKYVGYMYDNNTIDSNLKELTDDWYVEYIGSDGKYLEDTVWCNDRRVVDESAGSAIYYYAAYKRLGKNFYAPDLDCPVLEDSFTVSEEIGNGKLTYPIGHLTADEMVYGGAVKDTILSNEAYFAGAPFYTITPYSFYYGTSNTQYDGAKMFTGTGNGMDRGLVTALTDDVYYVRPAISLNNDMYILAGDGTTLDPYIVGPNDISDFIVSISYSSASYYGKEIELSVTVKYQNYVLTKGVDYSLKYENNIEVGTASVIIEGIGNYKGKVVRNFQITPGTITYNISTYSGTYDGRSHTGAVMVDSSVRGAVVKYGMTEGVYDLTEIPSFINAGNYTVYFEISAHGYTTKYSSFTVNIYKKNLNSSNVTIPNRDSEVYTGEEIIKEISVYDGSKKLVEGTDYKVTYSNNIKVGQASFVVTGMGNYDNTLSYKFNIIPADIEYTVNEYSGVYDYNSHSISIDLIKPKDAAVIYENVNSYTDVGEYRVSYKIQRDNYNTVNNYAFVTITAKDISNFNYELGEYNSVFNFEYKKPSLVVKDNNYVLIEGKDYYIEYKNNYNAGQASIVVTGIGNYSGSKILYFNIENANFVYNSGNYDGIYDYNNHGISLDVEYPTSYVIKYGLESGVYDLDEMPLFKNVGTYNIYYQISADNFNTVTSYNTITIIAKDIKDFNYSDIKAVIYDGSKKEPSLTIKDGKYNLSDTDYEITYSNNINAGVADILIKGIGNYVGYNKMNFIIEKANMVYIGGDYEGIYDYKEHGILLDVDVPFDVKIRYANENGEYVLDKMPLYSMPGTYTIKYQLTNNNYHTVEGFNVVNINPISIDNFMIEEIDSYTFNNEYITPSIVIKDNDYVMQEGVDYYLTYSDNYNVGTAKVNVHGIGIYTGTVSNNFMIHKADINYLAYDYVGEYDGLEHTISLDVDIPNYTINYADEEGIYQLTSIPKYKQPGIYKVFYEIKSDNYHTVTGYRTVTIYGIDNISDNNVEIIDKLLKIKDNDIDMLRLQSIIKVIGSDYSYNHLNSNKENIDNSVIKTGDYIQIVVNDKILYEFVVSKLGDVNGDGKISALDYVSIKNHIMKTNVITLNVNLQAADANDDDKVSALDYVKVKNYIMNGGY